MTRDGRSNTRSASKNELQFATLPGSKVHYTLVLREDLSLELRRHPNLPVDFG
jgi:hypothetical protein